MTIRVWNGVQFSTVGRKLKQIIDLYPGDQSGLYVTSSLRPGDSGSHHGGRSFSGSATAAVDVGFNYGSSGYQKRARDFASWLYQYSDNLVELIVSKVGSGNSNGGYYVKNTVRVGPYAHTGSNTSVRHEDHVHIAISSTLADRLLARIKADGGGSQASVSVMPISRRPTLRQGSTGGAVGHLQFLLHNRLKYDIAVDNIFGPNTEGAVRDFQDHWSHLETDGIVGYGTWNQLEVAAAKAISPGGRPELQRGDDGAWVGYAQHCLRKHGYNIDHVQGFPFGPQTEAAVRGIRQEAKDKGHDFAVYDLINEGVWKLLDRVESGKDIESKDGVERPDPGSSYDNNVAPIFGWDASDFDHDRGMRASHIREAAKDGIRFFTHKITEKSGGGQWVHTRAGEKLAAARDAGVPFLGAYVVVRTGISVKAQVDFALAEANRQCSWWKDFPGWFWQVDLEKWSYDAVPVSVGVQMCEELERRTGKKVVLYAPRWAYGNSIPAPWNSVLWNSHYVSTSGNFKSIYPGSGHGGWNLMAGKRPVILQYSSRSVIGGQHTCDANAFEGTEADFARMINAQTDPGSEEPEGLKDLASAVLSGADEADLSGLLFLGIQSSDDRAYGYHNSRARHLAGWTRDGKTDYSVQLPLDNEGDPQDASALDLGNGADREVGTAVTALMTRRLLEAIDRKDSRIVYLREFYGTLEGKSVVGRSHNSEDDNWRLATSSDLRHRWHLHLSVFRRYADSDELMGIAEVLLGIPEEPEDESESSESPDESEGESEESESEEPESESEEESESQVSETELLLLRVSDLLKDLESFLGRL